MTDSPTRIAVVDDDLSVRNALQRLLTITGFHARSFSSGPEFLGTMYNWPSDCLIVDLKMPGMSGSELLRRVSERTPHLPVILITAADSPESRMECANSRATYLVKPFADIDLIEKIGSCLLKHRVLDALRG
jgi:FixJ family two-component response regulator